jgi:putative phosphoribosyl transferase
MAHVLTTEAVHLALGPVAVDGDRHVPERAELVVFAHGSGSSRFSRRNRAVAKVLEHAGFGTLLLDLLTREEEAEDERTTEYRFNIPLLGERVIGAVDWV